MTELDRYVALDATVHVDQADVVLVVRKTIYWQKRKVLAITAAEARLLWIDDRLDGWKPCDR